MLLETFDEGMMPLLRLILKIIYEVDPELHENLKEGIQETPGFAISWILTWLSHEISDLGIIARIFDYFICSHPLAPVYVAASVIIFLTHKKS